MRGHASSYKTKHGEQWRVVFDLGDSPCQRCDACNRRFWLDQHQGSDCPQCGGPLRKGNGEAGMERRQRQEKRGQDGKPFLTKRDADRHLIKVLGAIEEQTFRVDTKLSVAIYLGRWLDGLRGEQVKATTFDSYRRCVERYIVPRIGGVKLRELSPEHLDAMYNALLESGGRNGRPLSRKSVRHCHTALHKALVDAVKRGHVRTNVADLARPPSAKQSRRRVTTDRVWDATQIRAFLATVEFERLFAAWHLVAFTGMRRGELLGLRVRDVDLDTGVIHVGEQTVTTAGDKMIWHTVDDGAKTEDATRRITVGPATVKVLRDHLRPRKEERMAAGPAWVGGELVKGQWVGGEHGGLLFTNPDGSGIHPSRFSQWFTTRVKRSGIKPALTIHGLRHSYASVMLREGAMSLPDLAARLGHSDPAITLSVYSHVMPADDKRAGLAADRVLSG